MTDQEKIDFKEFILKNMTLKSIVSAADETYWLVDDKEFTEKFLSSKNERVLGALIDCVSQIRTKHACLEDSDKEIAGNLIILLLEVLWLKSTQKIN